VVPNALNRSVQATNLPQMVELQLSRLAVNLETGEARTLTRQLLHLADIDDRRGRFTAALAFWGAQSGILLVPAAHPC
jgi:hypothetical protein